MKDLTKGRPSTLILAFALPIFLANLLQLTYSLVDTRIVGSFLGEDTLAAVGATTTLSNLMIGFLMGLSNGFAIITAQKFGAKNIADMKKSFAMSLVIGTGISILFTIFEIRMRDRCGDHCIVPCIFTADPAVFECIKGIAADSDFLHIYYYCRIACYLFI